MFRIDAAKEAGYSDAEIANYLAEQNKFDIKAAREAGYDDTEIADFLTIGRELGAGEALAIGAERAATAEIRGASELLFGKPQEAAPAVETPGYDSALDWMNGTPLSPEAERSSIAAPDERQLSDIEREQQYRIALRQQPVAAITGAVGGSVVSPSSAVGLAAKGIVKGALTVGGFGAATGLVEPVYEEFGDSRLTNVAIGGAVGGVLGGAIGGLVARQAKKADELDQAAVEVGSAVKTREQIEAELPKLEANESLPALLSKAPEADQSYVDKILSRYGDEDVIPINVLNEVADTVEDTNVASLFRNAAKAAEDAVPENQAAKAMEQQQSALTSAATEATTSGKALSKSSIQYAEKTGDYRDYLTTSVVRLADIPPSSFARMTAEDNPYKGQNFKMLISRLGADDPNLQQIFGGIQGRMKYERQTGKSFEEITRQALDEVPENVAIDALLNKKVEEILPPEIYASAIKATGRAVDDLLNAQDLARYARETGSDEAYAVLQSQMSRAAALVSALEGNASNLGRALAYQKTLKNLIDANRELPGYLGGVRC